MNTFSNSVSAGRPPGSAADEIALHALECRQGEHPLVFLHGLGRNHSTFNTLARRLSAFWNSWLLDLRGHGSSPHDAEGSRYHVVDYVNDVTAWLRGRWKSRAVLYGHSLGAMIAAAVAATCPAEVAAVVLEDPPFHTMGERIPGTFWEHLFRGLAQVSREARQAEVKRPEAAVEKLFQALSEISVPVNGDGEFQPLKRLRDRASLEFSAQCLAKVDPAIFDPVIPGKWLEGYDLEAICESIECPVFLLQGNAALGGALVHEDAELFRHSVRQCQLRTFTDRGHQIHWPEPDSVLPVFDELERRLAARTSI